MMVLIAQGLRWGQTAPVGGQRRTAPEIAEFMRERYPQSSHTWGLTAHLADTPQAAVAARIRQVELSMEDKSAWGMLGQAMQSTETATIHGSASRYSRMRHRQAAVCRLCKPAPWHDL